MKIFYMRTFFWNCIETHISNTENDIICVDVEDHYRYSYDNYLESFKGRKCIHLYPMSSDSKAERRITIGMPLIDTYGNLTKLKKEIVNEIGDEKDIMIVFESRFMSYRNEEPFAFYRFFLDLKKELSFNLHIVLSMNADFENDTYRQYLLIMHEINNISSACVFNENLYTQDDPTQSTEEWIENFRICDELFCSELSNVIAALVHSDKSGFRIYNHRTQEFESLNIPDEYIS